MSKTFLGLLFILVGLCYGSLALDDIYNLTLGYLIKHEWVKPPVVDEKSFVNSFGKKPTILLYSCFFIIIGIYLLWNRNS